MAEQDRIYKCLSPVGIELPVKTYPLAPRLDTIDGKTIHISITGEPDITIAMEKKLREDYPNVNWTQKKSYMPRPVFLTEEEKKTTRCAITIIYTMKNWVKPIISNRVRYWTGVMDLQHQLLHSWRESTIE